jgi:hypothetical protein
MLAPATSRSGRDAFCTTRSLALAPDAPIPPHDPHRGTERRDVISQRRMGPLWANRRTRSAADHPPAIRGCRAPDTYHLLVVFSWPQPTPEPLRDGPDQPSLRGGRDFARRRERPAGSRSAQVAWRRIRRRHGVPRAEMSTLRMWLGGRPPRRPPEGPISSSDAGHAVESHDAPTNAADECTVSEMFVKQNLASRLICADRLALPAR